jgi:hypothetical protein
MTLVTVESDTAAVLRRILAEVDAGRLDADSPRGHALVRHVEGAAVALEQVDNAKKARPRTGSRASR